MAVPVYESDATGSSAGFGDPDVTITKPSRTVEGDYLIAHFAVKTTLGTVTPPSGWAQIGSTVTNGDVHELLYDKFAGASEPSSYTWDFGSSTDTISGGIARISGVDSTTPVNATSSNSYSGDSAADESPSVTTTVNDCLVLLTHAHSYDPITNTVPSGTTEQWAVSSASDRGFSQVATTSQATAGATGAKTWDISGFAFDFVLRTVAIAPAGGGGGGASVPLMTFHKPMRFFRQLR